MERDLHPEPPPAAEAPSQTRASAGSATARPAQIPFDDSVVSSKILAVALAEIVHRGYDATSVRTIAREVGVTVPALYYYYENKQAILVALLDTAMTYVATRVEEAAAAVGEDPVRRLSAIVNAICLYMAHHPDLAFLDSERRSLRPENLEQYLAQRDRIDRIVDDAIATGIEQGVFLTPMPGTARRAILSMCQGIATWFRPDGPTSAADTAAEHVRIALAAVQCTTAPSAEPAAGPPTDR